MQSLAPMTQRKRLDDGPAIELLVADDDPAVRSLLASRARAAIQALTVLEAEDGAQAIQIGLQRRPRLALLDVDMPRLGGIEAAITLRGLQPRMRLALHTSNPGAWRGRARDHRLALFDTLELDQAVRWLELQARTAARRRPRADAWMSLTCSACGYGVARAEPPDRCPMCHDSAAWIPRWRPPFDGDGLPEPDRTLQPQAAAS